MKLSIRAKLLLAYFFGALLMVSTSGYAVYRLYDLTRKADFIINNYFEIVETSRNMMDTLLSMEGSAKKYFVLKDSEIAGLYWASSREFDRYLESLNFTDGERKDEIAELKKEKEGYDHLFSNLTGKLGENKDLDVRRAFSQEADPIMDEMVGILKRWEKRGEVAINRGLREINRKSAESMRITAAISAFSLLLGLSFAIAIIINISRPVKTLKGAALKIGEGIFDTRVDMDRSDEIGHLAKAFNFMAERLKELESLYLDASPLTGLPGNLAIEREINRRLRMGIKFSLCHVDLDNFKPFADSYGYAWGSEVIKETASIIQDAKKVEGKPEDFIGHIGGDDFVLVADPDRALRMSDYIVRCFAERTYRFYSEEERARGYILARDRKGEVQKFPLVTITISIVTDDGTLYKNAVEMARAVARVKEFGKTMPGSNFVTKEEMLKCGWEDGR
ncbi:MAG TPA: HAMP domain-containing protein [Syntrophales bacterium]|nr:HAMP domain-containing protein [Syntrophales bacterium]HOL59369.1 HAMP domain-containing protein [Syntrophales bacterium]HPO35526.1 HAMP domain-containing protein [Syntrophales bacterium]